MNQATGEDLDPRDEQRDRLERKEAEDDRHGDKLLDLPPVNRVFPARVHSITKFGCFVELLKSACYLLFVMSARWPPYALDSPITVTLGVLLMSKIRSK
jgi:hypothetical protein